MKRLVVTAVLCLSLLVAAPVAWAGTHPGPPSMTSVSCSVATAGGTWSWSFRLPATALPWFQQALARAQQYMPGLTCSYS